MMELAKVEDTYLIHNALISRSSLIAFSTSIRMASLIRSFTGNAFNKFVLVLVRRTEPSFCDFFTLTS